MCGLSVIIGKDSKKALPEIEMMNSKIIHRGPDSEGYYTDELICMGHRRLSIIDISDRGHQPMCYQNKYHITYNGEIYNYIELRETLLNKGYKFESDTDTEVILASFDYWGKDCVKHFNGMWAFCIYNSETKTAFLSRDRYGIKPLYFLQNEDVLYFGSEIKQLIDLLQVKFVNKSVLMNYLVLGTNEITNDTFFERIKSFPPSTYMEINVTNGETQTEKYYELNIDYSVRKLSEETIINRYHALLQDSINLRLRSDVKVGTCLSGGLDSSYIASIAAGTYNKNSKEAFIGITASSIDLKNDESTWANKVAENGKMNWKVTSPTTKDFFESIADVIYSQEEPFTTPSIFMQYFVMKKASEEGCVVMLDGQGGDETLLGYERYFPTYLLSVPLSQRVQVYKSIVKKSKLSLSQVLMYSLYFTNTILRKSYIKHRSKYVKKEYLNLANYGILDELSKSYTNTDSLQVIELFRTCLPHLLKYEDRNSMRFSIEARLPFIDYRVVELAISIAPQLKIKDGWTKYVLRKGSVKIIPDEIRWRRHKVGFESPDDIWMKDTEKFMDEIKKSAILKEVLKRIPHRISKEILWRLYNVAIWEKIFDVKLN